MENLEDVTQALMQTRPCPAVGSLSRMANGTDTKVSCHLDSRSWTDHGKALPLPKTGSGGDAGPGELDLVLRPVTDRLSGEESLGFLGLGFLVFRKELPALLVSALTCPRVNYEVGQYAQPSRRERKPRCDSVSPVGGAYPCGQRTTPGPTCPPSLPPQLCTRVADRGLA